MSEQYFAPTPGKLEGLRQQGVFPETRAFTAAVVLAVLLFCSALTLILLTETYRTASIEYFASQHLNATAEREILYIPLLVAILSLGICSIAATAAGILLRGKVISPIRGSLFGRRDLGSDGPGSDVAGNTLIRFLLRMAFTLLAFSLCSALFYLVYRRYELHAIEVLSSIILEQLSGVTFETGGLRPDNRHGSFLLNSLAALSAFAVIFGAVSHVVARVLFRRRHRMTRSELESELRESEMSPELRQQLGSRSE